MIRPITIQEQEIDDLRARCLAAEAEVKQQGITIGYFQQKLDAAEAERDALKDKWEQSAFYGEREKQIREVLHRWPKPMQDQFLAVLNHVDEARKERDQYKREADAFRALEAGILQNVLSLEVVYKVGDIALFGGNLCKLVSEIPKGAWWEAITWLEAIENAMKAQQYVGEQAGGYWIISRSERPHDTEAKPESRVAKPATENVTD